VKKANYIRSKKKNRVNYKFPFNKNNQTVLFIKKFSKEFIKPKACIRKITMVHNYYE